MLAGAANETCQSCYKSSGHLALWLNQQICLTQLYAMVWLLLSGIVIAVILDGGCSSADTLGYLLFGM